MAIHKYNPSINIVRDRGTDTGYIPTQNGKRVVGQMAQDFEKGIHAFNIIGSYGTEKSSFLLALEQSLSGQRPYYQPSFLKNANFRSISLVGSYSSLINAFAAALNVGEIADVEGHILTALLSQSKALGKDGLLFVFVDEFGKFLEYAAKNGGERELYFAQQLADFVNKPDRNIALVTTVHQSFESYANDLRPEQRNEWTKVKGRFREILFNEPVEQLLYLAAEHFKNFRKEDVPQAAVEPAVTLFQRTKAFSTDDAFAGEMSELIRNVYFA